jgi:molybdenum cofactor cytidylyltransferase
LAIVLAAGASRRMGRPKALLPFDGGVCCLDLVLAACDVPAIDRVALVVAAPHGPAIAAHVASCARRAAGRGQAVTLVSSPRPERGPISSIQAGLGTLRPGDAGFVVFPVDMPLVRAVDLQRLCDAFAARPPGTRVVAPARAGRRGHPVLAESSLAPALLAQPDGASARDVLGGRAQAALIVAMDDDRTLCDMDTPDAYEACLRRHRDDHARGLSPPFTRAP